MSEDKLPVPLNAKTEGEGRPVKRSYPFGADGDDNESPKFYKTVYRSFNICKHLGVNCVTCKDYLRKRGTTTVTVDHLIHKHGAHLVTSGNFKLQLENFYPSIITGSRHQWTPVIVDLKDERAFLICIPLLNKSARNLTFLTVTMQKPGSDLRDSLYMRYSITKPGVEGLIALEKGMKPEEVGKYLEDSLPYLWSIGNLRHFPSGRDFATLEVNCQVEDVHGNKLQLVRVSGKFTCEKLSLPHLQDGMIKINEEEIVLAKPGDLGFLPYLNTIFSGADLNIPGYPGTFLKIHRKEDSEYLKTMALFHTAQFGSVQLLDKVIKKLGLATTSIIDQNGENLFHYAIRDLNFKRGLHKVFLLCGKATDFNILTKSKANLLHYAALHKHFECAKWIVEARLLPNCQDKDGNYPVHYAMKEVHKEGILAVVELLELLLDLHHIGRISEVRNHAGETPLDWARKFQNEEFVNDLTSYIALCHR